MNALGRPTHYFAGGNTAKGFIVFYDSVFQPLERLFILTGSPGTGKSAIMAKIASDMLERGYDVELLHHSLDPEAVEGVIVTDLKVGIVDSRVFSSLEPQSPNRLVRFIDLETSYDSQKLNAQQSKLDSLAAEMKGQCEKAYRAFSEALRVHDEWEEIYIQHMHREAANLFVDELIQRFFSAPRGVKAATKSERFLGAATPKGAIDFVPNLTERARKRYFLKGRPGSGKSTLLVKLASAAQERGYDVEIYHCGFDPDSLDMIILPDLSLAIFDSTAPHEYFPTRDSDEIIDMYAKVITPGTDEMYQLQLENIVSRYSRTMKQATAFLAEAGEAYNGIKEIYEQAADWSKLSQIRTTLQGEIDQIAGMTIFD